MIPAGPVASKDLTQTPCCLLRESSCFSWDSDNLHTPVSSGNSPWLRLQHTCCPLSCPLTDDSPIWVGHSDLEKTQSKKNCKISDWQVSFPSLAWRGRSHKMLRKNGLTRAFTLSFQPGRGWMASSLPIPRGTAASSLPSGGSCALFSLVWSQETAGAPGLGGRVW